MGYWGWLRGSQRENTTAVGNALHHLPEQNGTPERSGRRAAASWDGDGQINIIFQSNKGRGTVKPEEDCPGDDCGGEEETSDGKGEGEKGAGGKPKKKYKHPEVKVTVKQDGVLNLLMAVIVGALITGLIAWAAYRLLDPADPSLGICTDCEACMMDCAGIDPCESCPSGPMDTVQDLNWQGMAAWLAHMPEAFLEQKAAEASTHDVDRVDDLLLGLRNQYVDRNVPLALASYYMVAAQGHIFGQRLIDLLNASESETVAAQAIFRERHLHHGGQGHFELGTYYLGDRVFSMAQDLGQTVPIIAPNRFLDRSMSNRDPKTQNEKAYQHFYIAWICGVERASLWMQSVSTDAEIEINRSLALQRQAEQQLSGWAEQYSNQDQAAYCRGETTAKPDSPAPPQGPSSTPQRSERNPRIDELMDCDETDTDCMRRRDALSAQERARYFLRQGDAELARGDIEQARTNYHKARDEGEASGAQASRLAVQRLQVLNISCRSTARSRARIGRDAGNDGGAIISVEDRQKALRAVGHDPGSINGRYTPQMSAAVEGFQRRLGQDETGDLTPLQTTLLICIAAQVTQDVEAQDMLGVLYAAGIGVEQNADNAVNWLKLAHERGSLKATFNLAMLYGTGTVLASYRLCDAPDRPNRADQLLQDAARRGHPLAREFWDLYGKQPQADRWRNITEDLKLPPQIRIRRDAC